MSDVAGFLTARIDEEEIAALDYHDQVACATYWQPARPCNCNYPERVSRQVEAMRAIIKLADRAIGIEQQRDDEFSDLDPRGDDDPYVGTRILRALAAIWSDHPDYQQDWTP